MVGQLPNGRGMTNTSHHPLQVCVACNPAHQYTGPLCQTNARRAADGRTMAELRLVDRIVELMTLMEQALVPLPEGHTP